MSSTAATTNKSAGPKKSRLPQLPWILNWAHIMNPTSSSFGFSWFKRWGLKVQNVIHCAEMICTAFTGLEMVSKQVKPVGPSQCLNHTVWLCHLRGRDGSMLDISVGTVQEDCKVRDCSSSDCTGTSSSNTTLVMMTVVSTNATYGIGQGNSQELKLKELLTASYAS